MDPKLVFAKETAKLAAYVFVVVGLVGTARGQVGVVQAAWKGVSAKP